jgi:hypothetical protein
LLPKQVDIANLVCTEVERVWLLILNPIDPEVNDRIASVSTHGLSSLMMLPDPSIFLNLWCRRWQLHVLVLQEGSFLALKQAILCYQVWISTASREGW